jgi:hypothetical protein
VGFAAGARGQAVEHEGFDVEIDGVDRSVGKDGVDSARVRGAEMQDIVKIIHLSRTAVLEIVR